MKIKKDDNLAIITLDGRIDQEMSEDLENALQKLIDEGYSNICMDMTDVKHICSSALGVIVAFKRKIKNEGDIKLVITNENLLKLFQTTMLDKVFEIFESQRECLSAFD